MSESRACGHRSLGPADRFNSPPMCVDSPGEAIPRFTPGVGEGVAKAVLSVGYFLVRLSPVAFLSKLFRSTLRGWESLSSGPLYCAKQGMLVGVRRVMESVGRRHGISKSVSCRYAGTGGGACPTVYAVVARAGPAAGEPDA